MIEAIQEGFNKYAIFNGRTTRSRYWYFYLFCFLVTLLGDYSGSALISNIAYLVIFLPLIAAGVRRMHDVDKSGWFLLFPIYNIILLCTSSTGENRFGPSGF